MYLFKMENSHNKTNNKTNNYEIKEDISINSNMISFKLNVNLLKKTMASQILERIDLIEDDDILIFKVNYRDDTKVFTWEVYKNYKNIKNFLNKVISSFYYC